MRIRNLLVIAFLLATLVPSMIFGVWSFRDSVEREFGDVKDRHLLIAQNLGFALERYHKDVVAAFEAVSVSMLSGTPDSALDRLLRQLNIKCILIVDEATGRTLASSTAHPMTRPTPPSPEHLQLLSGIATEDATVFSPVVEGADGGNELMAVRRYGTRLAIAQVSTEYFLSLGRSVAFGVKGHAAIVDQYGNILSHPLPDWVAARKNIAQVSAVRRMMNGETGIEQFYSPALKGDMIAGLTAVSGPGWGVMVPQPVAEIYDKVSENERSIFFALAAGLSITFVFVLLLIRLLSSPLEKLVFEMKRNARNRELSSATVQAGPIMVAEIREFQDSYNTMVQNVNQANAQIATLAYTDSITGLPNRARFEALISDALEKGRESDVGGALVLVDLDNFKEINDIHGHGVGDEFLRICSEKLKRVSMRRQTRLDATDKSGRAEQPIVARIGGDEFTILVPGIVEEAEVQDFLDELRVELSQPSEDSAFISECSASIGCSRYPKDGVLADDLIKRADIAMYHAKNGGKNRAEIFHPETGAQTATEMRRDILVAIREHQLELEYQPKVSADSYEICGVEALVRWDHPQLGRLPPGIWLPAIFNSPAIGRLGEWVIERAMQDHNKWRAAGHDLTVGINVGSKHFVSPGFIEFLTAASRRHDIDVSRFEIEVTEDALFVSESRAKAVFQQLSELGYSIAIDDFGKGYSNIARLAQLPVDRLKIDRSIVVGASHDRRIHAILTSTVAMARRLGCQTVAEGIETLEQAEFATRIGVDILQGFYFSEALSRQDVLRWIESTAVSAADHVARKAAVG